MKKSKPSSSSKKRRRSPSLERKSSSTEIRPKHSRARSRSRSRSKSRSGDGQTSRDDGKVLARKTRWHAGKTPDRDKLPKKIASSDTTEKNKKKGPSQEAPLRIKDLLDDKEKIIDHLFLTISGTALQELIPDYLKNRSNEELKKLCLEQINCMSKDLILHVISGKDISLFEDPESQNKEKKGDAKAEQDATEVDAVKEEREASQSSQATRLSAPAPDDSESLSNDVLELFATSKEMESIIDEENQVPSAKEKEVAEELPAPESDAELLELEMRARAIRSLLKARCHVMSAEKGKEHLKDLESKK